ncbi:MAG: sigma-70 family RNA polymerase sigma factor, partial [Candidatus Saccharimonadales bacterium]
MALKLIEQAQNGDPVAMERLWLDSQAIAEAVVRAKGLSVLPQEDMVQIALEVVPGTIERYDSTRGASLETFLSRRMLGAVIDAERKHSNISRKDYAKLQDALESDDPNASLHALTQSHKADSGIVTPGLTMASTFVMNGAVSDVPKSLDAPVHAAGSGGTDEVEGGTQIDSGSDVHEEVVRTMDDERVRAAIDALPEPERLTILNYDPGPGMNLRE